MKRAASGNDPLLPMPKDLDAERFVLAWILQNPQAYSDVAKRVGLDDFSLEINRRIFVRMGELYVRQLPIDIPTLGKALAHHNELGPNGWSHLAELDSGMPKILDFDGYVRVVHQKRKLRDVISIGDHLINSAATANGNTPEVIVKVQELLTRFIEDQADDEEADSSVDLRTFPLPAPDDDLVVAGIQFPRRHPTILFGDGGSLKSYLALFIAGRLAQRGIRVALFDWELSGEVHRERLERIFSEGMPHIEYARCDRPLVQEKDRLQRIVKDKDIEYAVFDSVAFGSDGPPEDAEVAGRYFRAVRQIGIGALLVGHIGKNGDDQKPFGSVFWHHSARSTWYAHLAKESPDEQVLQLGLYNRKCNLGQKVRQPLALDVCFSGMTTTFSRGDVSDSPDLAEKLPIAQRIEHLLRRGPATLTLIAEELGVGVDTVRKTVDRYVDKDKLFSVLDGHGMGRKIGLKPRSDTCSDTPSRTQCPDS
jgi:hypothetical protein